MPMDLILLMRHLNQMLLALDSYLGLVDTEF